MKDPLPSEQDLITMIYCDLCVLSPQQREVMYQKVHDALNPGGLFLFDVMSIKAYEACEETSAFGRRFMGGFWAEGDYFAFKNTFKYDAKKVSLDKYTVVEACRIWHVFNWMQYFDSSGISAELAQNGFDAVEIAYDFANSSNDGSETHFGVIAKPIS